MYAFTLYHAVIERLSSYLVLDRTPRHIYGQESTINSFACPPILVLRTLGRAKGCRENKMCDENMSGARGVPVHFVVAVAYPLRVPILLVGSHRLFS
jgi:hypothetical protein